MYPTMKKIYCIPMLNEYNIQSSIICNSVTLGVFGDPVDEGTGE